LPLRSLSSYVYLKYQTTTLTILLYTHTQSQTNNYSSSLIKIQSVLTSSQLNKNSTVVKKLSQSILMNQLVNTVDTRYLDIGYLDTLDMSTYL